MKESKQEPKTYDKPKLKYALNLDAIDQSDNSSGIVLASHASLTLKKWRELSKKDPSSLTSLQKRQLDEANKMLTETLKRISEAHDSSGLFKSLQALPTFRISEDIRRLSMIAESARLSVAIPTQSLISMQKSLAQAQNSFGKQFTDLTNAALAARGMFADFDTYHKRLIQSFSVNVASLSKAVQFTPTETVRFDVHEIAKQDNYVIAKGEASQIKAIDGYVLVHKASLNYLFTELKATHAELSEVKKLVSGNIENGISKIEYADVVFKREASKLILKGYEIVIKGSSHQSKFCDLFFRSGADFVKKWDIEELVFEAFGAHIGIDGTEYDWINKIRSYIFQLNQKIALGTRGKVVEFFVYVDLFVYINPKYADL